MLKTLKKLTWDDNWKNLIQYGQLQEPVAFDRYGRELQADLPDSGTWGILTVMWQLKDKMPVYDAYLKAIEYSFSSHTLNQCGAGLQKLVKLKKQEIKNLKKGIFDEELAEYIEAATKGYKKWCDGAAVSVY